MRYFRASAAVYEAARLELDALWGHPNDMATTCIVPAADALRDNSDRVLLAVPPHYLAWPEVTVRLDSLIAAGLAEEIDQEDYQSALPTHSPLGG